jgi:hypothetical protein
MEAQAMKRQSRTWKLTVYWATMPTVMVIAQIILRALGSEISLPLGEAIALGGAVSTAYMAKRGVQEARKPKSE